MRYEFYLKSASLWRVSCLLALLVSAAGCAAHRGAHPTCKGPFSPINVAAEDASHVTQR